MSTSNATSCSNEDASVREENDDDEEEDEDEEEEEEPATISNIFMSSVKASKSASKPNKSYEHVSLFFRIATVD